MTSILAYIIISQAFADTTGDSYALLQTKGEASRSGNNVALESRIDKAYLDLKVESMEGKDKEKVGEFVQSLKSALSSPSLSQQEALLQRASQSKQMVAIADAFADMSTPTREALARSGSSVYKNLPQADQIALAQQFQHMGSLEAAIDTKDKTSNVGIFEYCPRRKEADPGLISRSRKQVPSFKEMQRNLQYAGVSYCDAESVKSLTCGPKCNAVKSRLTRVQHINVPFPTENSAMVAYDKVDERFIVAVKGTRAASIRNWVTNLDFLPTDPFTQFGPNVTLHEGFWSAWTRLKPLVLDAIQGTRLNEAYNTNKVLFVGHSLGGAVATNGAFDLQMNHDYDTSVMTFGGPRVGNKKYARLISENIGSFWRVTYNKDLVVHVPPRALGFIHPPGEIHFPNRGSNCYKVCKDSSEAEDNSCANSCSWSFTCTSLEDHGNYVGQKVYQCPKEPDL